MKSNLSGKAYIQPDKSVPVGISGSWTLTYVVGEKGIAPGGGIRIETPGILGWSRPQIENAEEEGYVTVSTSNMDTKLICCIKKTSHGGAQCWTNRIIEVIVVNSPLKKGDCISVVLGDIHRGLGQGWKVTTKALKKDNKNFFLTSVDTTGRGKYSKLKESPFIKADPGKAEEIEVIVPSLVNIEEDFKIGVWPKDLFHNPVRNYCGALQFNFKNLEHKTTSLSKTACPLEYKGPHKFSGFKLDKKGIWQVEIKDLKNNLSVKGNPVKVTEEAKYNLYWGDIHTHSSLSSDNILCDRMEVTPCECYEIGRDVAHLDFMAITDHHIPRHRLNNKSWDLLGKLAHSFYQPGSFVPFFAFECTCERGDTNVYFLEDKPKHAGKDIDSIDKVWKYYKDTSIMTIPHFHNPGRWKPEEWKMNPAIEPVAEIASIHGIFEYFNNPSPWIKPRKGRTVHDLLNKRYKVGIIASSDDHKGQPGFQELVAVYAKELTREAIWEALKERRCYGTTHARIVIKFVMDGHIMGESYKTDSCPEIDVEVIGTNPLEKIELIKDGKVIYARTEKGLISNFTYKDDKIDKGESYYYLRVTQTDREMAWSSPIFVNFV